MPPHPNHPNNEPISIVQRARYSPPVRFSPLLSHIHPYPLTGKQQRNRLNSEIGIIDATTLILLQNIMADSYEHRRVVWKEKRARCARTGEAESDEKVEAWLVEAGLLAPDDETLVRAPESAMPPTPQTPRRRPWPWHRRLEIVIPRKFNNHTPYSSMSSEPSASSSPRSPLYPIKLWSAVQRGTAAIAIPVPVVRLTPTRTHTESSPSPSPSSLSSPPTAAVERPVRRKCVSLENTPASAPSSIAQNEVPRARHGQPPRHAFKCAVMLETITYDDDEAILRRLRGPPSPSPTPLPDALPSPLHPTSIRATPKNRNRNQKPKPKANFDAYPSPLVLHPPSPPPPPSTPPAPSHAAPDVRWYHLAFLVFLWHFLIVSLSVYAIFHSCTPSRTRCTSCCVLL
ncbi:hypothetical protein C8R45DRAFT_1099471 [Mycena sanguinolenta]|nr:hypothetical protein C8R45DRAFT_1099471 [Mycena sanguinolenta]